jgi:hypothetical protein
MSATAIPPDSAPAGQPTAKRFPWSAFVWVMAPSLVASVCVVAAMNWPVSSEVEIHASARSAQFHLIDEGFPQTVLEGGSARTISVIGFRRIRIPASALWIFNPTKYDFEHDNYPEAGWERLSVGAELVLAPVDRAADASVMIRPEGTDSMALAYGAMRTAGGTLSVSTPERRVISVHMQGGREDETLQLPDKFVLLVNHCKDQGTKWPYPGPSVALRAELERSDPFLSYTPSPNGILVQIRVAGGGRVNLLPGRGLAVDGASFEDSEEPSAPESSLDGSGKINFVEPEGSNPVPLEPYDILSIGHLDRFFVREAVLERKNEKEATVAGPIEGDSEETLQLLLGGEVGTLNSGPRGLVKDRRLTLFDELWHNPRLLALYTILVWLVPTLVAVRKFFRKDQTAID